MSDSDFPGYRDIDQFYGGDGYDWSELHVYTKDGRVFYTTDAGCSCSSWNDGGYLKDQDLIELPTLEAARTAFVGWSSGEHKWFDVIEIFRNAGLR